MNQNDTQQTETRRTVVDYETDNDEGRAEMRTPDHEDSEVTFARMMEEPSDLQVRMMEEAEARGIPTHIIDLPAMMTPQYDDEGRMYVEDCNRVVRYYINVGAQGQGELVPTDDFIQNAQTVESNERTNTFEKIYNTA